MFRFEWLGLAALVAATLLARPARAPEPPAETAQIGCVLVPGPEMPEVEPVVTELQRHLDTSLAIAADPTLPPTDVFQALRRAQKLDLALGGGRAEELAARMRVIAPRAALVYELAYDRESAALARHTAEMLGAP